MSNNRHSYYSYQERRAYQENINIWKQTTAWYLDGPGRFIKPPPAAVKYNVEQLLEGETDVIDHSRSIDCDLSVINEDTFTVAAMCWDQGYNPMVLNMANAHQPGGGVYKGSMAQEEDLFRRSDYFLAIPSENYPIEKLEVVYSPRVTVYLDKDYHLLERVQSYSCLACAAERDPQTIPNPDNPNANHDRLYESIETAEITRQKILGIFRAGIENGHDCLVLGSLGCGAFNNPQMRVIEFFNEGIEKYCHYFRKIVFAVLSKDDPNYDLFSEHITLPKQSQS